MSNDKKRAIKVSYNGEGWVYELVDENGKHAGSLDITYRFENGDDQVSKDQYYIFLEDNLKEKTGIIGYSIRVHEED